MEIGETLYVVDRKPWREWLEANFETARDIWLIYPNKASGQPRILYNDAVEEALCFGWIDSIIKKLDPLRAVQRFSPRNPKSSYSQPNAYLTNFLLRSGMSALAGISLDSGLCRVSTRLHPRICTKPPPALDLRSLVTNFKKSLVNVPGRSVNTPC